MECTVEPTLVIMIVSSNKVFGKSESFLLIRATCLVSYQLNFPCLIDDRSLNIKAIQNNTTVIARTLECAYI